MSDEPPAAADQWWAALAPCCPAVRGSAHCGHQVVRGAAMNAAANRTGSLIRGLYAITPDQPDTVALLQAVEQTLAAGTRLLQYRNKAASPQLRREQLKALQPVCGLHGCTLIVNDDWQAAIDLGIDAVHIGGDDGDVAQVRAAVGPGVLLGVSCYASLARAAQVAGQADYLAFGSVFASTTKPAAVPAALALLAQARAFGKPVVAIGGIDKTNARLALEAGADAVAVISAVFGEEPVFDATRSLLQVIDSIQDRRGA